MRKNLMTTHLKTVLYVPMIFILLSGQLFTSYTEDSGKHASLFGITIGLGMTVGGTIYATWQYKKEQDAYSRYSKSAFTDNTTELHDDVQSHTNQRLLGTLIAGLGAVCIVVSF